MLVVNQTICCCFGFAKDEHVIMARALEMNRDVVLITPLGKDLLYD